MSTTSGNPIYIIRNGTTIMGTTGTIPAGKTYFSVYNAGDGVVTLTFNTTPSTTITIPSGIAYTDENNNGFEEITVNATATASTTAYVAYSK